MGILVMAGQLLLALGMLVFIHELGHFLAARAFNIRVDKFFIFFDINGWKLWSKKIGDTEYGIGWFPLGGYVKIAGMIDESNDKEFLNTAPEPWEFRSKPAWQRFIVMMGGITMNVILGIIIFAFWLMHYQQKYLPPENLTDGIYAYEMGAAQGLQTGDKILEINGKKPDRFVDYTSLRVFFGAKLTVDRGGNIIEVDLPDELFQQFKASKDMFIGPDNYKFKVDSVTGAEAIKAGLQAGDSIIAMNGEPINVYGDMRKLTFANAGKTVDLLVVRGNERVTVTTPITMIEGRPAVGFITKNPYEYKDYNIANSFYYGSKDGFEAIYFNAVGLGKIAKGKVKASESVQSPLGMALIFGSEWQWSKFWYLTGLISFILAFMNLLPIPALDGGHVVFILIEVIRGKPVSDEVLGRAQVVGMVVLLTLMTFAFGNDLYKIYKNFIE